MSNKNNSINLDGMIENLNEARQKQKTFTIGIDMDYLVSIGKARYEPPEKVSAFKKRLSDYMKPLKREAIKKLHQSYIDVRNTRLD